MNNKPSLSDVARQTNSNRVSKFAGSMIPAPPVQRDELTPEAEPIQEPEKKPVKSLTEVVEKEEEDFAEGKGTVLTVDELKEEVAATVPTKTVSSTPETSARSTRKRSGTLFLEDIISEKAPDGENFGKMTRIAEKHHDLLREIAFIHRKNMNTILYNLLEVLNQTYQRDKQNHA